MHKLLEFTEVESTKELKFKGEVIKTYEYEE